MSCLESFDSRVRKKGAGWIKNHADLDAFKKMYGIDGEIEKEY